MRNASLLSQISKLPVVYLMGPTATGKSDLAIKLSKALPCTLISVDSAMVYKGMDIGTSKPEAKILASIPHKLINIREPIHPYSVGEFVSDAYNEIYKSFENNKVPLLVGGTMLYFYMLQKGIAQLPSSMASSHEKVAHLNSSDTQTLYTQLEQCDPEAANRIHPNDIQRIQRALFVYHQTGQTITKLQATEHQPLPYRTLPISIFPNDREKMRKKIACRFNQMLKQGFIQEVETLYQRKDLNPELPASRSVGYRQVLEYLKGDIDYDLMKSKSIFATCQLAKRQLTWLRRWSSIADFNSEDPQLDSKVIDYLKSNINF